MSRACALRYFIVLGTVTIAAFLSYCLHLLAEADAIMRAAALGSVATILGVIGALVAAVIVSAPVRAQLQENAFQNAVISRPALVAWIDSTKLRKDGLNTIRETHYDPYFSSFYFVGIRESDEAFHAEQALLSYRDAVRSQANDGLDQKHASRARRVLLLSIDELMGCMEEIHYPDTGDGRGEWTDEETAMHRGRADDAMDNSYEIAEEVNSDFRALLNAMDEDMKQAAIRLHHIDQKIADRAKP